MDADAADAGLAAFDLAGVDARADLDAQVVRRIDQLECAAERPGRGVEDGHDAVAGELHVLAVPALDDREDRALVLIEQLLPGPIADGGRPAGGIDDVGEEDARQRPVDVLGCLERADLLARPLVLLDERARSAPCCRARR